METEIGESHIQFGPPPQKKQHKVCYFLKKSY